MEDLMDFVPSGWKRDLTHMVGCFYASQIGPLNTQQWYSDWDKFLQAMEDRKGKWLDIKELEPLYVIRRQMLRGQHGPQLEGTWPAHEVDQAPELLPLEGS